MIKKIIPCLDTKDGKVVKGINFTDIKSLGDPVEFAKKYQADGADELVLLDISATVEGRKTYLEVIKRTSAVINIPLAVGGGIASLEDFEKVLAAGASKASVNSAAVLNPSLISEISNKHGKQKLIVAIDVIKNKNNGYNIVISGGNKDTGIDAVEWAKQTEQLGAGEILLTSRDTDGVKDGFDIELNALISDAVSIPVTASGGCGKLEDFLEVFTKTNVQNALAASIFHYNILTVKEVKEYLKQNNIPVRI